MQFIDAIDWYVGKQFNEHWNDVPPVRFPALYGHPLYMQVHGNPFLFKRRVNVVDIVSIGTAGIVAGGVKAAGVAAAGDAAVTLTGAGLSSLLTSRVDDEVPVQGWRSVNAWLSATKLMDAGYKAYYEGDVLWLSIT